MFCSISGEVPVEPVVSPKSGSIFDKKNIVNFITINGTDPINDEPLTIDELISIKSTIPEIVPPKPPQFSSIPLLLSTFQNEWDALALEVFTLRKLLAKAREELSAALYHHDAAVRVAANAIRERDEAKQALQELSASIGQSEVEHRSENGNENGSELNSDIKQEIPADEINQARDELYQFHKSQKPTLSITPDQKVEITSNGSIIHPFKLVEKSFIYTPLKSLILASKTKLITYNYQTKKSITLNRKKGLISGLNYIEFHNELIPIVAYKDKVYLDDKQFKSSLSSISQIIVHPKLTRLFMLLSGDSWSINDTEKGELYVSQLPNIVCGDIHVDGAIVAISTQDEIKIFSLTDGKEISQLKTTILGTFKLKFGVNGYWLLAASKDESSGSIDVFDLRKNTRVHSIELSNQLVDFIIDPSSSFIISYDGTLKLHRYLKKGKLWLNNVTELEIEQTPVSISFLNDENDDDFKNDDQLKIITVLHNSNVLEYQLRYV